MAANDNLPISALRSGATKSAALLATILILHALPPAAAQPPTAKPAANQDDPYNTSVSPALAILVVAIVSSFFLLGFFSVYLRRCTGDRSALSPAAIAGMVGIGGGRSRRGAQKGLDSSVLETFPTMVYSTVKGQKLGKESLECAVCLCEFEDDDILRLLPRCSHVFHRDCIDIWLASHVTCPVCRSNLSITDDDPLAETDHVAVRVDDDEGIEVLDGQDRQAELADLVRIGSQRREAAVRSRPGSVRTRPISSRSTVDWADVVEARGGGGGERFTLRLPEDLRRELLEAGKLLRSASFAVFPTRGEGSSRRGYREGMWRSLRIGRSGRWPFLGRNFSANGRGESAAAAEGSVFGSSKSVRVTPAPLGGLNGGGEKPNYDATSSSSTLTLKPV